MNDLRAPNETSFRVLVVHDNADTRTHVAGLLAPFADVDALADGRSALVALEKQHYDLLVTDVTVARLDGFQLLQEVRASPRLKLLPVVLVSDLAGDHERVEALSAAADDYLVNPFTAPEFIARMVGSLGQTRSRAEAMLAERTRADDALRVSYQESERHVGERTTELAWANAALKASADERNELRRRLAAAEEAERRRLARELHDQVGQQLTAFSLGLDYIERLVAMPDGTRDAAVGPLLARIAQLKDLAQGMTRNARYLALQLRPPELDDVGLESAMQTYVAEWSTRYGIAADVAAAGLGGPDGTRANANEIPGEVGSALYRIVQEGLINVAKHASASHVSVIVEASETDARLIIEDNGCGFDVEAVLERARLERRLGVAGMQERAALVGGRVTIESSIGIGTTVYVRLPLEPVGGPVSITHSGLELNS